MTQLSEYIYRHCSKELNEVKISAIAQFDSDLTLEERAIIYKYTEDGYEYLNETLRLSKGKDFGEFGKFLDKVLLKLPNHVDILYRSADLTTAEIQKYQNAYNNNGILVEHSFVSTSKSKMIAYGFGKNCHFRILSRSGKSIEAFAKYGLRHPQNEKRGTV